mgnify:CR=1 FL=1
MGMTRIESKQVTIGRTPDELYTFLQDMNNFQQLLEVEIGRAHV